MSRASHPEGGSEQDIVRIDKWLWAARFFKTRSLAAEAVERGHVLIDGQRVKPARSVRLDEPISVQRGDDRIELRVRGLSEVRGPAAVAQRLYEETSDSRERRMRRAEARRLAPEPAIALKGRPSKRDRRELTRLAGRVYLKERGE
ncbi:MAG TPA: S4 domain-containing protein [Burkholderiaceae bacterium]|nr:S4 domain-containing protein [Burkholderiaceae bacterium]HQR70562.1 S4 domain-containing protein [Burkholderiaceae bacterium]